MKLQDLGILAEFVKNEYLTKLDSKDIVLPDSFKKQVLKFNNGDTIEYNNYTMKINASSNLTIFIPNQWVYVAAFFVEYYNMIKLYRDTALSLLTKEQIKQCQNNQNLAENLLINADCSNNDKELLIKFLYDYSWWRGGKTLDRNDYYVSPILSLAGLVNASQSYVAEICKNLAEQPEAVAILKTSVENKISEPLLEISTKTDSRQIIYYGAPGTGKSNHIEECTNDGNRIRTTFHPDSDYSTFVGAYKPTVKTVTVYEASGSIREEEQITYSFVPQAFLKAYVEAWKRKDGGDDSPYYLVIEEINRGNCAQIFGDLFQLLDRDDKGRSRYAIAPDDDMRRHIAKELDDCTHIDENIRTGNEMRLPENLYIWATMNTSDQSLFPIDSAFKRRWDWEYMPIEKGDKKFVIKIGNTKYDWWEFISTINDKIETITFAEDKKLGYWFAKPANGGTEIDCKHFVSKVLFYLWNDVYKDYADSNDSIFRRKTEKGEEKLSFTTFFGAGQKLRVKEFMDYNKIMPLPEEEGDTEEEDATDELAGLSKKDRDYSKYRINDGAAEYGKGALVRETIAYYCSQNPEKDASAIKDAWMSLNIMTIPHLVETQTDFEERTSTSIDPNKRAKVITLNNGESIYVSTQIGSGNIKDFIDKVNLQDWNIRIEKA